MYLALRGKALKYRLIMVRSKLSMFIYLQDFRRYVEHRVAHSSLFDCRRNFTPDSPPALTLDSDVEVRNDFFSIQKEAISGVTKNRTPGEDGIPCEMIQKLHKSALKVLLKIYNGVCKHMDSCVIN